MAKNRDQKLVDDCNRLALMFYKAHGYTVEDGYRFDQARHPQERGMWNLAATAFYFIKGACPDEANERLQAT